MTIKIFLLLISFCCLSCNEVAETKSPLKINSQVVLKDSLPSTPIVPLNYLMGKFDPNMDDRFAVVNQKYADRNDRLLRTEAYEAFKKMWDAAKVAGVDLKIISATRNFDYQKGIWERKWNGVTEVGGKKLSETISDHQERARKILEYSSMPGTSRHHWGTDLDLNAFENRYFESGQGQIEYDWLVKNAGTFGFCQPYTANRPYGYQEEKWHWSFLPLSKTFTKQAELHLKDEMIEGFDGAATASKIQVVKHYVLGINQNCIH